MEKNLKNDKILNWDFYSALDENLHEKMYKILAKISIRLEIQTDIRKWLK